MEPSSKSNLDRDKFLVLGSPTTDVGLAAQHLLDSTIPPDANAPDTSDSDATSDSDDEPGRLRRCLSAPSAIVLRERLVGEDSGSMLLTGVRTKFCNNTPQYC